VAGKDLGDPCNYDFGAAVGAAVGGAVGGPANSFIGRYWGVYRGNVIGSEVGSANISRMPGETLGAIAEGFAVGAGELGGSGLGKSCTCNRP